MDKEDLSYVISCCHGHAVNFLYVTISQLGRFNKSWVNSFVSCVSIGLLQKQWKGPFKKCDALEGGGRQIVTKHHTGGWGVGKNVLWHSLLFFNSFICLFWLVVKGQRPIREEINAPTKCFNTSYSSTFIGNFISRG